MSTLSAILALLFLSISGPWSDGLVEATDQRLASEPTAPASATFESAWTTDELAHAEQLLESGDHDAAVDELRRLLALDPDNTELLKLLGSTLCESGQAADALPYLERAAELDPRLTEVLLLLGSVQQELQDTAGARDSYQRYLALEPTGAFADEVRYILGQL